MTLGILRVCEETRLGCQEYIRRKEEEGGGGELWWKDFVVGWVWNL